MKCDGCGREFGAMAGPFCVECYVAFDGYDLRHVPDKALRAEYDRRHLPLVPAAFGHARMEVAKLREECDEWKRRAEAAERLLGASRGLGLASLIGGDAVGTSEVLHDPTAAKPRRFELRQTISRRLVMPECGDACDLRGVRYYCAQTSYVDPERPVLTFVRASPEHQPSAIRARVEPGPGIAAKPTAAETWPLEVDLLADDE